MIFTVLRYILVIGVFSGAQFFAWEDQHRARESENLCPIRGSKYPPKVFRHMRYAIWACLGSLIGAEALLLTFRLPLVSLVAGLLSLVGYAITSHALHRRQAEFRKVSRHGPAHRWGDVG